MERDDDHKKWVWKRETGPERREKDDDGRATARDSVEDEREEVAGEVSPLVSLWRSALGAMQEAVVRSGELKQHEIDELDVRQMSWHGATASDGEPN